MLGVRQAHLAGPQAYPSMFPARMSKTAASATVTTSTRSSASATGSSDSSGISTGAIRVGVALGAIAVASILAFRLVLLRRRKKKSKYGVVKQGGPESVEKKSHVPPPDYQDQSGMADQTAAYQKPADIVEVDWQNSGPVEMSASQARQELPA